MMSYLAKSARKIWEKLKSVFDGDEKTRQAKITNLKYNFENMRMFDDENIEQYIHQVNESVNTLRGVGRMVEESEVVRKIMETLPKSYKPKKYSIEESHEMKMYNVDQLLGSLAAFEIVEFDDIKKERKEVAFEAI